MPKMPEFKKTVVYDPPITEASLEDCYRKLEDELYPPQFFEMVATDSFRGGKLVRAINFAMATQERLNTAVACFPTGN